MIKHVGTLLIDTERLHLRRYTMDDAQDMFDNWVNDAQVTRYLQWLPHGDIQITRNILDSWVKSYEKPTTYNWAIELKENTQVIGSIAVVQMSEDYEWFEVGYCLSRKHYNKGIMTEALKAIIRFSFLDVGVNRVQAFHHVGNSASGKVMLKSGMKYEGCLRQYIVNNQGVFVDCDFYGIVKSDWGRN
ncbi:MAG: GNAT family N-acetyltransferase [Clostridiales bacterium]|jgi:RimJ/RimL family protein N-acetyltransferase|nr:GNAT family N-acetyltransferase [Clostridiales bacterium]